MVYLNVKIFFKKNFNFTTENTLNNNEKAHDNIYLNKKREFNLKKRKHF